MSTPAELDEMRKYAAGLRSARTSGTTTAPAMTGTVTPAMAAPVSTQKEDMRKFIEERRANPAAKVDPTAEAIRLSREALATPKHPILSALKSVFTTQSDIGKSLALAPAKAAVGALASGQRLAQAGIEKLGGHVPAVGEGTLSDVLVHGGELGMKGLNKLQSENTATKVGGVVGDVGMLASTFTEPTKTINAYTAAKTAALNPVLRTIVNTAGKIATDTAMGAAGASLLSGGKAEDIKSGAKTSAAVSTVFNAVFPAAGWIGKEVLKNVSSGLSGVPPKALEKAWESPDLVQKAMRDAAAHGEDAQMHVVENVKDAFAEVRTARSEAYKKAMSDLEGDVWLPKNGTIYVKKAGEEAWTPTQITLQGVKAKATSVFKEFGRHGSDGSVDSVIIGDAEKEVLRNVKDMIDTWDDITPMGLEDLSQEIGQRTPNTGFGSTTSQKKLGAILGALKGNVRNYLVETKEIPHLGEAVKQYAEDSKFLENAVETLNLESKPATALRSIMSMLSSKNVVTGKVMGELGARTGRDFASDVAGVLLSKYDPATLVKQLSSGGILTAGAGVAGGLPAAFVAALSAALLGNPRVLGEVTTSASQAVSALAPIAKPIIQATPAIVGGLQGETP